jgi:hypothetical protein
MERGNAVSWPDMMNPWNPQPPPAALPLRDLILSALAEAFLAREDAVRYCRDCTPGRLCADHRLDADLAAQYEAAYTRLAAAPLTGALN